MPRHTGFNLNQDFRPFAGFRERSPTTLTRENVEDFTRAQIGELRSERTRLGGLTQQAMRDVENLAPERQLIGAGASSLAAQALRQRGRGTTFASTLANPLRVAKARQGVEERGEESIRNQRLQDRLAFAREGIRRRGAALGLVSAGRQIRSGVDVGMQRAKDIESASRANLIGTGLGAAAGVLTQNFRNTGNVFDFGVKGPGVFSPRGDFSGDFLPVGAPNLNLPQTQQTLIDPVIPLGAAGSPV